MEFLIDSLCLSQLSHHIILVTQPLFIFFTSLSLSPPLPPPPLPLLPLLLLLLLLLFPLQCILEEF